MKQKKLVKRIYKLLNKEKNLGIVTLIMNYGKKKQLLLEMKDGSKYQLSIRPYKETI